MDQLYVIGLNSSGNSVISVR